jgi:hypothetical protein
MLREAARCSLYRTAMYLNAPNLMSALLVGFTWLPFFTLVCTDKKENQIFLIYREIQSGAVATAAL